MKKSVLWLYFPQSANSMIRFKWTFDLRMYSFRWLIISRQLWNLIKTRERITRTEAACGKNDLCNPCVRLWFSPHFFWWMWILMLSFPFLCWMLMLKCSLRCKRKIWDTGTLQVRRSRWVELLYSIKLTSYNYQSANMLSIWFGH